MTGGRDARWVTVFNGARDGYQVPLALAAHDRLEALVTDWYSPLDQPLAGALARALPARGRAFLARRYREGLPSAKVRWSVADAVRQRLRPQSLAVIDERLGRRAGRLATRRGAGILSYSFYAHAAFGAYMGTLPRVLFQVQAHPAAIRRVLAEEMDRAASASARAAVASEPELTGESPRYQALCEEPSLADLCIVPSSYTRSTLVEAGVDPSRIRIAPYGVDLDTFYPSAMPPARRPFRVMFAGQLVRRKGLAYLLEAWRRLALPDAELLLVGRGRRDDDLLREYAGTFTLVSDVHSRAAMRDIYQRCHVCCLPSLTESFGLVFLEAMACGTPVIGTPNTGAADIVEPERNGFVVPVRDVEALCAALSWCYTHSGELEAMRASARRRAEEFSWPRFRRYIADAVDAACERSFPTSGTQPIVGAARRGSNSTPTGSPGAP